MMTGTLALDTFGTGKKVLGEWTPHPALSIIRCIIQLNNYLSVKY